MTERVGSRESRGAAARHVSWVPWTTEAREVVAQATRDLRRLSYEELCERLPKTVARLVGGLITVDRGGHPTSHKYFERPDATYELETQIDWDEDEGGDVRVAVRLWRIGNWRPIAGDEFVVAPDGSYIDE